MPKYIETSEDVDAFFKIDPNFDPNVFKESFLSYKEAKLFAQKLKLLNVLEWFGLFDKKDNSIPRGIPRRPHAMYEEFEGYDMFLGLEKKNMSRIEIAENFLIEIIGSDVVYFNKILEEASKHGISERTIRRAKDNLSIRVKKNKDGWVWYFPNKE